MQMNPQIRIKSSFYKAYVSWTSRQIVKEINAQDSFNVKISQVSWRERQDLFFLSDLEREKERRKKGRQVTEGEGKEREKEIKLERTRFEELIREPRIDTSQSKSSRQIG